MLVTPENLIKAARDFAIDAHKDMLYGDLPYEYHLRAVVAELPAYAPRAVQAAAWLHDVVEDVEGVGLFEIRERFGGRVARLVDLVTDEPGKNRKERKAKTYDKLAKGDYWARTIKLADRIANMKASIENPGLAKMYRKEFPEFIRRLGKDEENEKLVLRLFWIYLDSLEASNRRVD